jgi:hypothetical protein
MNPRNGELIMTTMNANVETTDVRALTEAEIGDVAGGATFGGYLRKLAWQVLNAPSDSVLIGCSDDMSVCTFQSK